VLAPSPSIPVPSQTRAIVLLAVAGFASQAMVRVADSLLPQIAVDFGVTVGAASIVVSAYAVMHGSMQLISGPVGDRVGKYRMIAIATAFCAVMVFACGLTLIVDAAGHPGRVRRGRGMDHPARHGLYRRCRAL
jgi:YNFM family putative membrane transporter